MNAVVRSVGFVLAFGGAVYARAWRRGWSMPPPLGLDEWADRYRVLTREGSSEPGRWRTSRTPYVREIMQMLSVDHPAQRIVFKKSTQIAGTETGLNWIGSMIHQNPGPMMAVQPTSILAKRWSRQRLGPMIESTPDLRALIKPARSRDSGNTTLLKEFPGGVLVIAGANSAVDLRSMPVRYLFADEVDGYPEDIDGEGAPLKLAERRTSTFPRRKIFIVSTPTIKDASVIDDEYAASDQRSYYVPCPHCMHMQTLREENLKDDGTYLCEHCATTIEHHFKTDMLARGEWRAQNPTSAIPGFHINALYAPIGLGYTWKEIADERRIAINNPEKMQAYVNTLLGESYENESGKVEWSDLKDRAGGYASRTIPQGCLMLTAGVDVQDDRFAILVLGWGRGEKCWVIDWLEIPADPSIEHEWKKLDAAVLGLTIVNRYGVTLRITAAAFDTGGHHTHMAYNFCRTRKHRLALAVKGDRYPNRPIIAGRPSKQDVNTLGGVMVGGVELWRVGTDTAKGAIFSKLHADQTATPEHYRINFARDLPDEFYLQLTAERFDAVAKRWKKLSGRRNEGLDCFVYGYAAACHPALRVHMLRDADWDKIANKIEPHTSDLFAEQWEHVPDEPAQPDASPRDAQPENNTLRTERSSSEPHKQAMQRLDKFRKSKPQRRGRT